MLAGPLFGGQELSIQSGKGVRPLTTRPPMTLPGQLVVPMPGSRPRRCGYISTPGRRGEPVLAITTVARPGAVLAVLTALVVT